MPAREFFVYTDASFSNTKLIGVSGILIFRSAEENEAGHISPKDIHTQTFKEKTNIRAEIYGAISALEAVANEAGGAVIHLYSDCQTLTDLLRRRDKLEATGYMSLRKKEILANADLYQKFLSIYDQLHPILHWVKGHSSKKNQDLIQKNFSAVDQAVRKNLRSLT